MSMYHFTIRAPGKDIEYATCARTAEQALRQAEYAASRIANAVVVPPSDRRAS